LQLIVVGKLASLPLRERGSKLHQQYRRDHSREVAPFAGAWIEEKLRYFAGSDKPSRRGCYRLARKISRPA